jgi:hypothetical protein
VDPESLNTKSGEAAGDGASLIVTSSAARASE